MTQESAADRIVFVGAGKMGAALLSGLARAGAPGRVEVVEPNPSAELEALCEKSGFALYRDPPNLVECKPIRLGASPLQIQIDVLANTASSA